MGLKSALSGGAVAGVGLAAVVFIVIVALLEIAITLGFVLLCLLALWFVLALLGLLPPPPLDTMHTMGAPA